MPCDKVCRIFYERNKINFNIKKKNAMEIISMGIRTFDTFMTRVRAIEEKTDELCLRQEDTGLKKWLDNQDVCDTLGISKRTLQTYRDKGLLPFSRIKNKLFYKPEDVEKLLQSSYHPNTRTL